MSGDYKMAKESFNKNFLSQNEIQKSLKVSNKFLNYLIEDKQFPNVIKEDGEWKIPLEDINQYKEHLKTLISSACLTAKQAAKRLNYKSDVTIKYLMYTNKIKGAFKFKRTFYIPLENILKIESDIKNENDLTLTLNEVADILKIGRHSVVSLFKKGNFPNTYKGINNEWRITKIDIENYRNMIDSPKEIKSEFLTEDLAVSYLGFSNKTNIRSLIMNNTFPHAIEEKNYWKIPKSDLDNYLNTISNVSIEHSNKVITTPQNEIFNLDLGALKLTIIEKYNINELKSLIDKSNNISNINKFSPENLFINFVLTIINNFNNIHLYETTVIYIDFCQMQINNLSGENHYKNSRVKSFINLYTKFSKEIQNELSKTQLDSISKLISGDSKLTVHEKKIFSNFVKYYFDIKGIVPKERLYISKKRKTLEEKELYSPEEFYILYNYAIDIKQHTKKAVANRNYANMWVYVQLLLTDFIRGQDLIHNTPNIELEHLNISSLNWFSSNILSETQANLVIKQLYFAFRHKRTSKTNELITFIISPDIIVPLATALVISELHRRKTNSGSILDSFFEGKYQKVKTQGKISHRHFFYDMKKGKDFVFGSRKMNNSVATYLFYSIAEQDGNDSDLALHLTQKARSHTRAETTGVYIQATNKDGSINKVSYNLFKRGHFGWLYNYLILYSIQFEKIEHDLSARTRLIENLRNEQTPFELESISEFIHNFLKPKVFYNESEKMSDYISNLFNKRQSIISKLSSFSKEEISGIIKHLAKGKLPAKNENCQCLIYPNCKYPNITNCYSCEYVLPRNIMLIQLNNEFERIINEIDITSNKIMLRKNTKFLLNALFILKEARNYFGEEFVNGFIPIKDIKDKIYKISEKLYID